MLDVWASNSIKSQNIAPWNTEKVEQNKLKGVPD